MNIEQLEQQCLSWLETFESTDAAHDISHVKRVVTMAKKLCEKEKANIEVVLPAAYLHDCITLPKNHPDNNKSSQLAADKAVSLLRKVKDDDSNWLAQVHHAICCHSYSADITAETIEAKIVQDADRLDGLGAIGIARCMAVAGKLDNKIYAPIDPFCHDRIPDSKIAAIDHFYEKLFKTALQMQTSAGKEEARNRVQFMQDYLLQLGEEIGQ